MLLNIKTEYRIFEYMESLLVYPKDKEQLKMVKAVLKALKVPFEIQKNEFPSHVLNSIEKSLEQFNNGETISFEEFKSKHFTRVQ